MVRKQPRDYPERREAEQAQANTPLRMFLTNVAGPLFVAAVIAGLGGIVASWRNDLLHTERLGVIALRVAELEEEVKKGELKRETLQTGLTELRILVARMRAKERNP